MFRSNFKIYRQLDSMDCGPACLRMIIKYYGRNVSLNKIKEASQITREGVSLLGLSETAEKLGILTRVKFTIEQLAKDVTLPCILLWN